ncbi:S-adenosyl-L-methionine-dependent methyltransferase [Dichotomopilus funicola]|uniref:tRNA wybutosine-synthesizing protein 2 n=1 Tax=Dichotomopilus funicola TaxID=1934379 RepID=A0AAN6UX50_9PEZI|nr:S-adenosyl-L-methionine-dependent methyltransferase [Dichotomopilus funicola]
MGRPPKPKQNPVQAAVSSWLDFLPTDLIDLVTSTTTNDANDIKQTLLSGAPKRWVVYEPMVLLPSGSFSNHPWPTLLSTATSAQKDELWTAILRGISPPAPKPPLTHLAVNEGIPLHNNTFGTSNDDNNELIANQQHQETENLLRSPTNLHPLYGSFGPLTTSSPSSSTTTTHPSDPNFNATLWVSAKQNGLIQTWTPLHTMFSRGNIKEKARLLSFHQNTATTTKTTAAAATNTALRGKYAIDLYAGIGYFVFSYAALGLRVLCWELNAWSVEGLRRGAEANGFSVRVVSPPSSSPSLVDRPSPSEGEDSNGDRKELAEVGGGDEVDMAAILAGPEQIIVFLEDNRRALERIRPFLGGQDHHGGYAPGGTIEVVHVNCGFLPTSQPVWHDAWEMATVSHTSGGRLSSTTLPGSWLHLHENVGVADIEKRKRELQVLFDSWAGEQRESAQQGSKALVEHVELVKTYAPGVWHCVFDVRIVDRANIGD